MEEQISRHPIRVVALRTGLKPDVLRVWERRYGVVQPTRSEGGQRLYSDADIGRLALLRRATSAGRSISQTASLTTAELERLVAGDDAGRNQAQAAGSANVPTTAEHFEAAWLAVTALAPARLHAALRHAFFAVGGTALIDGILTPLFERVGREWEAGRLSPAHEHAASVVVRRLLDVMVADMDPPPGAPAVLVAAPSGERHEFGALLVAATAAAAGWHVVYLGADLPAEDIIRAAREGDVQLVALSVVHARNLAGVGADVTRVARELEGQASVVVGGRAAQALAPHLAGAELVLDLPALRTRLAVPA